MKKNPLAAALLTAFGLKGLYDNSQAQLSSMQTVRDAATDLRNDVEAILQATEEAGSFSGAE